MQRKTGEKRDASVKAGIGFPASCKPEPKGIKANSGIFTVSRGNIQKKSCGQKWVKNNSESSLKWGKIRIKRGIRRVRGRVINKGVSWENGHIKIGIWIKIKIAYGIRGFWNLNLRRELTDSIKCSACSKIKIDSRYCRNTQKCLQRASNLISWQLAL